MPQDDGSRIVSWIGLQEWPPDEREPSWFTLPDKKVVAHLV
jgi:hypothetical protein